MEKLNIFATKKPYYKVMFYPVQKNHIFQSVKKFQGGSFMMPDSDLDEIDINRKLNFVLFHETNFLHLLTLTSKNNSKRNCATKKLYMILLFCSNIVRREKILRSF